MVKEKLFSSNSFASLELDAHLIDCLEKRFSLKKMTQIQENSIPQILNGKDCFVKSQTGSGKTLAYAIPVVQRLMSIQPKIKRTDGIRALVLVPTREVLIHKIKFDTLFLLGQLVIFTKTPKIYLQKKFQTMLFILIHILP